MNPPTGMAFPGRLKIVVPALHERFQHVRETGQTMANFLLRILLKLQSDLFFEFRIVNPGSQCQRQVTQFFCFFVLSFSHVLLV